MFYNYLIFNMVTLSLRILLKYCVSHRETNCFTTGNHSFQGMKQKIELVENKRSPDEEAGEA